MDNYEITDYKLLGSISNIKSSLFDIISDLNQKIISLEEINDDDPKRIQMIEELKTRLRNIIDITTSFSNEVVLIDVNYNELNGSEVPEMENDDSFDNNEEKEEKTIESEETDDDTVILSDKVIDDMMEVSDEENTVNVDLDEKEEVKETTSSEDEKINVFNDEEETSKDDSQEEKPVIEEIKEVVEETPLGEVKEAVVEEEKEQTEVPKVLETIEKQDSVNEEEKKIDSTEEAINKQKEKVTNKEISYIINKDTIDPARAILVTSLQYEKLLLSRDEQKTLCKLRKYMVMPGEKEEPVDLEKLLQEAEKLYREGNTAAAEELYNKISELNK